MTNSQQGIDADLACILRGADGVRHDVPGSDCADAWLAAAEAHGVTALLNAQMTHSGPSPIVSRLREAAQGLAAWEISHRAALRDALASLASEGVVPVLFKGTALAYSLYPSPALRMRGDTDMLVPAQAREAVTRALTHCGFAGTCETEAGPNAYQTSFSRPGLAGAQELDVHWRINNSEVLSGLFTYEELRADAVQLPSLAPGALAASPVHALLLACMHRAVHRHSPYYVDGVPRFGDRLIWLYDMHLLAAGFRGEDWDAFVACARSKGLMDTCLDGLTTASGYFGTHVPPDARLALQYRPSREPASEFLRAGPARQLWLDFRAVPGVSRKATYLRRLLFPSAEFMYTRFPGSRTQFLPWLYVRRAGTGAWRRLRGTWT